VHHRSPPVARLGYALTANSHGRQQACDPPNDRKASSTVADTSSTLIGVGDSKWVADFTGGTAV
jgi:hypothetical protein